MGPEYEAPPPPTLYMKPRPSRRGMSALYIFCILTIIHSMRLRCCSAPGFMSGVQTRDRAPARFLWWSEVVLFLWSAGGPPGAGRLGDPAGAPEASGLHVTGPGRL